MRCSSSSQSMSDCKPAEAALSRSGSEGVIPGHTVGAKAGIAKIPKGATAGGLVKSAD